MLKPFQLMQLFSLPVLALSIICLGGCETTDYEPLIMKKKLKEMDQKIQQLEQTIESLKSPEPSSDSTSESSTKPPAPAVPEAPANPPAAKSSSVGSSAIKQASVAK